MKIMYSMFIFILIGFSALLIVGNIEKVHAFSGSYSGHYRINHVLRNGNLEIKNIDNIIYLTHGISMLPTIDIGNKLLLRKYTNQTLKVGDIVVFDIKVNKFQQQLAHRIINIEGNLIKTQGDNNYREIEIIERKRIKYVVVGVLYT